jgi:hypothetical protein
MTDIEQKKSFEAYDPLHPAREEACVMIKRVWVFVPNPPYTTAGNDHPSPFSQGAVLPNHILSVRCVSELFIGFPGFSSIFLSPDIVPNTPGQAQDTFLQDEQVHVWQQGHTVLWGLPTALSLCVCGHILAVGANTPSGLLWGWQRGAVMRRCSQDEAV